MTRQPKENIMTVERSQALPLGALFIGLLGMVALAAGVLGLTGVGADWHPVLESRGTGLALVVVGLALSTVEVVAIVRFVRKRRRFQ